MPSVCRKKSLFLGNVSLCYLVVPMGYLCTTTPLNVTQLWYWELHLFTRDDLFGLCLPHFLIISFRSPLCLCMFQETSTVLGFYSILQKALNFSCLAPYYPSHPLFPHPPHLFSIQALHLSRTILFPFHRDSNMFLPSP